MFDEHPPMTEGGAALLGFLILLAFVLDRLNLSRGFIHVIVFALLFGAARSFQSLLTTGFDIYVFIFFIVFFVSAISIIRKEDNKNIN